MGELVIRYSGDRGSIASAVQKAIHTIDRNLLINHVTTLGDQVALSIVDERLLAQLSTFFGLLAVFLSSIGIYGLMSSFRIVNLSVEEPREKREFAGNHLHFRSLNVRFRTSLSNSGQYSFMRSRRSLSISVA